MTDATRTQPSNWNVPNVLTTLRIVLVPFFGWALLVGGGRVTVGLVGQPGNQTVILNINGKERPAAAGDVIVSVGR